MLGISYKMKMNLKKSTSLESFSMRAIMHALSVKKYPRGINKFNLRDNCNSGQLYNFSFRCSKGNDIVVVGY